jgi:(R,R)-butanediol dehydrogenase/meso-butanediol dehydrogenase/diacetyl reductase
MQAARYIGGGTIAVAQVDPSAPGPGEVQIAVAYTGICGTDLHIRHGAMDARVRIPAVIGHEMSGRIAAVGLEVADWNIGDPVTVMPLRWCGSCPACQAGHRHVCQRLDFLGIDSPGAMQERWTVPAGVLVRIPHGTSLRNAALVEPVAVAVHDVRRSGLASGESAVIVGGGPIGVLIACVARWAGGDVVLVEPNEHRRKLATELGFVTLDPGRPDFTGYIEDWTGGAGAAIAFEVSGSEPGVTTAMAVLGVRGRMVVVGIHPTPRPVNLQQVFWRELSLIGARVYERPDFEQAVQLVANGTIPAHRLISRVQPLASAAEAFSALESGGDVMKVLIDCRSEDFHD